MRHAKTCQHVIRGVFVNHVGHDMIQPLFDVQRQASASSSDAHSLLGVPPRAPKDVIKRAYRKLVLRTHPDIAHGGGSEERFIQVLALAVV